MFAVIRFGFLTEMMDHATKVLNSLIYQQLNRVRTNQQGFLQMRRVAKYILQLTVVTEIFDLTRTFVVCLIAFVTSSERSSNPASDFVE